eukprot:8944686-Pyramimonas_sp.AAC.1
MTNGKAARTYDAPSYGWTVSARSTCLRNTFRDRSNMSGDLRHTKHATEGKCCAIVQNREHGIAQ